MKKKISKKKTAPKKKAALKRKTSAKKVAPKKKVVAKRAALIRKAKPKKATAKKPAARLRNTSGTKSEGVREIQSPERSTLGGGTFVREPRRPRRGMGSESGGQSGDVQGLSRRASMDSESVEELAEEGQSYEAEVISGVEDALDPDQGEVRTREVPEDDVPEEYTDKD